MAEGRPGDRTRGLPDRAGVLVVGAGIVGLATARRLVAAGRDDVVVVEKEDAPGLHASGRNSGILHAGIYYAPESLKARSCLNGNRLMKAYCREKGLPLLEAGKVIVARHDGEIPALEELHRRAAANGARVAFVDGKELAEIEPLARTCGKALYSPETAAVDPKAVVASLFRDLEASGRARVVTGCAFLGLEGDRRAVTSLGTVRFDRFVNAAGAWSDRVAHAFGLAREYRLVPFKGIYRTLRRPLADLVRGNIYPVPDVLNPFLGVHFSRSIHGEVHLGPTAIPALGRENYGLLEGIGAEGASILYADAVLFLRNPKFRAVALAEPRKYRRRAFFRDAAGLVTRLAPEDVLTSGKAGIRAQLVDWRTKELVMDFLVVADGGTVHVLNPVSPAFTSAMDLAATLVRDHFGGGGEGRP